MLQVKKLTNPHSLNDDQIMEASRLFALLAEPLRLKLLRSLMEKDLTVTELVDTTGARQANVSKHLSLMLATGLVRRSKEGTFARYSLKDPFLRDVCSLVCSKMERDALALIKALKK